MSSRSGSAYTDERWMLAKKACNVPVASSTCFVDQPFLQSDTMVEVDRSHVMEVDLTCQRSRGLGWLKLEYFHAIDIPESRRCEVFVGGGEISRRYVLSLGRTVKNSGSLLSFTGLSVLGPR